LPSARLLAAFAIACLKAAPVSNATIGDSVTGGRLACSLVRVLSMVPERLGDVHFHGLLALAWLLLRLALSRRRGRGLRKLDALAATAAFATRAFIVGRAYPNFLRTSPPLSRQRRRGAPFARRDVLPTARPSTLGKTEIGRRELINRITPPEDRGNLPHHFPSGPRIFS
jgi:hypothetical protein